MVSPILVLTRTWYQIDTSSRITHQNTAFGIGRRYMRALYMSAGSFLTGHPAGILRIAITFFGPISQAGLRYYYTQ